MSRGGKALIKVGYACNNCCVFCHAHGLDPALAPAAGVAEKIEAAAALGCEMVVFSGGEPTIRPELPRWVRVAARRGVQVGLITNGRMLSYPAMVEELTRHGLAYAQVSLHSGNPRVHDGLVRAQSFAQTVAGVKNLSRLGVAGTATAGLVQGAGPLHELVELLAGVPAAKLKLSAVEPKGVALDHFDDVVPDLESAAALVRETFAHARRVAPDMGLLHEGFPHCLLPGLEDLAGGLREEGFTLMSEANEELLYPVDIDNRIRHRMCESCTIRGTCPGIYREYLARRPMPELPARGLP